MTGNGQIDNDNALPPDLQEKLDRLPKEAGVYIFRNIKRKVIYVGKAVNLRSRVRSYFSQRDDGRYLYPVLREQIADVETVVTDTEQEALVLENNLIKKFRPRYNIRLRDDATYISLKISTKDRWPRTYVVRRYRKDGNVYFGPFSSATAIRGTLEALRPVFPLRLCSDHTLNNRTRACIYHDIGYCSAPCVDAITPEQYREHVDGLVQFFRGRNDRVIEHMRGRMRAFASAQEFERAADFRDRIALLEQVVETQKTQTADFADRDVIGCYRAGEDLQIHVLFYRDGKLINSASHEFRSPLPDADVLRQFVLQFYAGGGPRHVPREVVTALTLDDADGLAHYLARRSDHAVDIRTPARGKMKELVDLANTNARYAHKDLLALEQREEALLTGLQQKLGLRTLPERIECVDVSTLQGTNTVASQVTFLHARPEKSEYKRYRISPENAGNDFDAMAEVVRRRIRRATEGDPMPDMLVLDGGPPQLAKVLEVFDEQGVIDVDLVALAKSRRTGKTVGSRTPERVYKPDIEQPVVLRPDEPETWLMQRIRDEAHRFAITYHRKRRRVEALQTGLESIPGLGPKRRHALLDHFGTSGAVRRASAEQLAAVKGISANLANTIAGHFASQSKPDGAEADTDTDVDGDGTDGVDA